MSIQLSLFPQRGYALLVTGELLHDLEEGGPAFYETQLEAQRALKFNMPKWIPARVVPVELHEPAEDDGLPTFVILGGPSA